MSLAMRQLSILAACALSLVLTVAPSAPADVPTAFDRLVAAAQILHVDAREARHRLGGRDSDLVAMLPSVDVLNARATALLEPQTARLRR